jgi:phosphate transport system protein
MLSPKILDLKRKFMEMAALVEKMAKLSFEGVHSGSRNNYNDVMHYEQQVNQLEMEIEDNCIMLMALFHPEAKDLRIILMIYKLNNDLERLGDQAVNIAESAAELSGSDLIDSLPELVNMQQMTLKMLSESITAFTNEDVEIARLVCRQDEIVDSYNRRLTNQLILLMKENPLYIDKYLHLLRISKNLERIADLSTNIGENTVYLVQGRVIKHHTEEAL